MSVSPMTPYQYEAVLPPIPHESGNKMIRLLADHFCYKKKGPVEWTGTFCLFQKRISAQVALQQFAA